MIYNLLSKHHDISVNGIAVSTVYAQDFANLPEFLNYVVLAEAEEAKGIILPLAAVVLRITVDVLVTDPQDVLKVPPLYTLVGPN